MSRPRVVVVGTCGTGKTTLAEGLKQLGYDAAVCGQEHSEISNLWQHTDPDLVIALEADIGTIRQRRTPDWPVSLLETQMARLAGAREAAAVTIDTGVTSREATLARAIAAIERWSRENPED